MQVTDSEGPYSFRSASADATPYSCCMRQLIALLGTPSQTAPEDPYHIQASACCKHYVANSMDGTSQKDGEHHDRNHVDSVVPMQDLIDSYMLPFQACVEKGKVSGLMCSCGSHSPLACSCWCTHRLAEIRSAVAVAVCLAVLQTTPLPAILLGESD